MALLLNVDGGWIMLTANLRKYYHIQSLSRQRKIVHCRIFGMTVDFRDTCSNSECHVGFAKRGTAQTNADNLKTFKNSERIYQFLNLNGYNPRTQNSISSERSSTRRYFLGLDSIGLTRNFYCLKLVWNFIF